MSSGASEDGLTVVIAAYQAQETISAAVKSALSAGAVDVVVVDDGSTDRTAERAEDAGATVFRQSNQGASAARRRGAASVGTAFLSFLDADDLLVAEGVQKSLELLRGSPEAAAAGGRVIGFAGDSEGELLPVTFDEVTTETLLRTGYSAWPPSAAVIRTAALARSHEIDPAPLEPRFAEDYEMLIRLARVGPVLRHDAVSMRYEMSGGKSVRSAQQALACKEQIREHYASSWGVSVQLMPLWRRRAAANKRIARAHGQSGRRIGAALRMAMAYTQGMISLAEKKQVAGVSHRSDVEVFEWAAGQDDNIGDSLLRRPSLADARARGRRLHIFHGPSSPTFDTGLGLSPEDVTYRAFRPWLWTAAKRGLTRPTLIIPNAGEVKVSRRGAVRLSALWAASLLPNVRVIWMGAGVPGERGLWALPYRLLARRARFAAFRDAESVELLGAGRTEPDWAFALGSATSDWPAWEARSRLSFILRGDRDEPSDAWIRWAARLSEQHGLTPTFVAQVRRDGPLAARLAARTGGEAVLFAEETTHADQEERVRAAYRETRLAVGDRLHGLVVAATEGAVPLGWVPSSGGKIRRHFDAVDMPEVGRFEGEPAEALPAIASDDVRRWAEDLPERITAARGRIEAARAHADGFAPRRRASS